MIVFDKFYSDFVYTLSWPRLLSQMCIRLVIRSQFDFPWVRQQSYAENDHEIFSTVILSLPLIQEGQLSVSGKRLFTNAG